MITRKMKNVSDRINNFRQRITGRNKDPQRGTYAQIPTENSDALTRFDKDVTNGDALTRFDKEMTNNRHTKNQCY